MVVGAGRLTIGYTWGALRWKDTLHSQRLSRRWSFVHAFLDPAQFMEHLRHVFGVMLAEFTAANTTEKTRLGFGSRLPIRRQSSSANRCLRHWRLLLALVSTCTAGCAGEIIESATSTGRGGSNRKGPDSNTSATDVCTTPGQFDPGPTFLRRLSNDEYRSTVETLFGDGYGGVVAEFPPDPLLRGFKNNSESVAISSLHGERYQAAAEQIAAEVIRDVRTRDRVVGCDVAAKGDSCRDAFIEKFGRRAFRRPLGVEEGSAFRALAASASADPDPYAGARLVIEAALQSPSFLFRVESGTQDPVRPDRIKLSAYELAGRLSFLVLGRAPDDALLDAAAGGALAAPTALREQAIRLLAGEQAKANFARFYTQWLGLEQLDAVHRGSQRFPEFSEELRASMREETTRLMNDYLFAPGARLVDAVTATETYVDSALARHYGLAPVNAWQRVTLPPESGRVGLLTHASILTITAHNEAATLIFRGKFVRDSLLCDPPPPPPPDIPPLKETSGATAEEALEQHTRDPVCNGCHKMLDPLGAGLRRFDAVGAYQPTDAQGAPIGESGLLVGFEDPVFDGPRELAARLAASPQLPACMVKQLFRYGFGRGEVAADACTLDLLTRTFVDSNYSFEKLVLAIVDSDAFRYRSASEQESFGGTP